MTEQVEQSFIDKLDAVEQRLVRIEQAAISHTLLLENIRDKMNRFSTDLDRLSKGLGIY